MKKMDVSLVDFGDYVEILQKLYGMYDKKFTYKVVGQLESNTWVDVPVKSPATEKTHKNMTYVLRCICCGVDESEVLRFRRKDVQACSQIAGLKRVS